MINKRIPAPSLSLADASQPPSPRF